MKLGARSSRVVLALAVISMMAVTAVTAMARSQTAYACPTTRGTNVVATCATYNFPYSHSWYITNATSQSAMQALAQGDATWSSNTCANNPQIGNVDFLTILDFGRPGLYNGVYSVYDFGTWQSYGAVQQAAQWYADTWYNDTSSCPRLHLVIGTASDYECYNGSYNYSCNVYTAGQQWDSVAHAVESHISGEGHSWQETIWAGDDLEGSWDQWTACSTCYPKAQDFVNGMDNKENSYSLHLNMVDYGDAGYGQPNLQGGPVWTPQNVYDAAWGIGWDVPDAELYVSGQLTPWVCIYQNNSQCRVNETQGGLVFYGEQAECTEADTLPTGNCYVQNGNPACQWSPYEGYTNLSNATGETSIHYSINIQWQGAAHTGNNGC